MNIIRHLMQIKGISTKEMAEKLGITPDSLNKKIGGRRGLSIKEINLFCDMLERSYEELFRSNDKAKTS